MSGLCRSVFLISLVIWLTLPQSTPQVLAEDAPKKQGGKVAGILIDKKDNWITVKADDEEEALKYVLETSDKKLQEAFKTTFNACRVQLTYQKEGDARVLTSIKRQIVKETGTLTGEVVKVHNDFWVEVKPKIGLANAFAPGANFNDKEFMALLRSLKPGDNVAIAFVTDFERHRITSLRKRPATPLKPAEASKAAVPSKK